jgi:hypothetical protein
MAPRPDDWPAETVYVAPRNAANSRRCMVNWRGGLKRNLRAFFCRFAAHRPVINYFDGSNGFCELANSLVAG